MENGNCIPFIVHHVILPPKLPQQEEEHKWKFEESLLHFVQDALRSFVKESLPLAQNGWEIAVNLLHNWIEVDKQGAICKDSLERVLANLKSTGAVAFNIRAQNCGWIAYYDKDRGNIIFDAFELSHRSADVLAASGSLRRLFPGQSVALPAGRIEDQKFCSYLAENLSRLSTERVEEMSPKTIKAGTAVQEQRDTTHPGLVTEGLMTQLLAFGRHNHWPSFQKHVRDEVNWDKGALPWRRSSTWFAFRVALQTVLQRSFPLGEGQIQYKNFMLYLVAEIGSVALRRESDVTVDQLAIIRVKLARRVSKVGKDVFGFVANHVRSSADDLSKRMEMVQRDIRQSDRLTVTRLRPSASEEDVRMSLNNCREYLRGVMLQTPADSDHPLFTRSHERRNQRDEYGLPVLKHGDALSFVDFEQWVSDQLEAWSHNAEPSETVCCLLAGLLNDYTRFAEQAYAYSPRETSLMFLVILELWVAIDGMCLELCPLLKDFSPQIPVSFLEPLLLPQWSQMQRANKVERYIRSRHKNASKGSPHIFGDLVPQSFQVRFYDISRNHQDLRERIEQYAANNVERKRSEWNLKSTKYKDLLKKAESLSHTSAYTQRGYQHHPQQCEKCRLENEASSLRIDVYEWPLPSSEHALKAAIFELDAPCWFLCWRDITWKLLHDIGRHRSKAADDMEQNLLLFDGLRSFTVGHDQRLTLGSTSKSWSKTHYKYRPFPVEFKDLCPPNGFRFRLLDTTKHAWAADQNEPPTLKPRCTLALPSGPYSGLQYAVDSFRHTQNQVVADQRKCDSKMGLDEFVAFGCLRAGERVQWYNIIRELESPTLSMNEEAVSILFHQAAWEFGSYSQDTDRREAHRTFEEATFGNQFLETLQEKLRTMESNWNESNILDILITLALRLLSLSESPPITEHVASFLRRCRKVAIGWCEELNNDLHSQTGDQSKKCQQLILKVAGLCQLTYDVEPRHLTYVLHSREDVFSLARSSVIMFDNTPKTTQLPSVNQAILLRPEKVRHAVEDRLRQLIQQDAYGFNEAIGRSGDSLHLSGPWRFYPDDNTRWTTNTTTTAAQGRKQVIHYNLLSGELLVDNRHPGRLPAEYTGDALYQRVFKMQTLPVIPSDLPGAMFVSAQKMGDYEVHFGMRHGRLSIKTRRGLEILELIPHQQLVGDFPESLVTGFVHWLDLEKATLEFRPLSQAWQSCQQNWRLIFSPDCTAKSVMQRGQQTLVDIRSGLFQETARLLGTLDAPEHIHVIRTSTGMIEAELVSLRLKFFVNRDGVLESRELNATVDNDQDIGCMYGLKNKLVVQDGSQRGQRSVLIPYGQVVVRKLDHHVHVSVQHAKQGRIKYFRYMLDEHLQMLRGPPDMLSCLYQSYLHASTSFVLPDPATKRSGTEEALRILRQASLRTSFPLSLDCIAMLNHLAALTPRRTYYPEHLRVMQTVQWKGPLGELARHDDFQLVTREISDHSAQFATFHGTSSAHAPISTLTRGDQHLLERARSRHSQFRCSEFAGALTPLPNPCVYEARDRTTDTERSQRVYEIALLVRDWPSSVCLGQDLVGVIKQWDHVCTVGSELDKFGYADLLRLSLQDTWGSLYDLCRLSDRSQDSYNIMSLLCMVAFGGKSDLSHLRTFLAVAFSGQLRNLPVPGMTDKGQTQTLDLRAGENIYRMQVRKAIANHYEPFDEAGFNDGGRSLLVEEVRRRNQLKNDYEQQKQRDIELCCDHVMQQWPREDPVLPEQSAIPRFHRSEAMQKCSHLFTTCCRNMRFFEFLREVQVRLRPLMSRHPYADPLPSPRVHVPVCVYHPFQSPTLSELICSWEPKDEYTEPPLLTYARDRVPQCYLPNFDSGLRRLIEDFGKSPDAFQRDYGKSLCQSMKALEQTQFPSPRGLPDCLEILLNYQRQLQERRNAMWKSIISTLTPQASVSSAVSNATLLPSITVHSMLSFLSIEKWRLLPERCKRVLVTFGKVISSLRRCERLIISVDQQDPDAFFKEAEEVGCGGWNAMEHPDWLLLEIENNITIRKRQAEVAHEMINPDERQNMVLQLHMGEGKTSVITPMIASTLVDQSQLLRIIVLKPLLRQSVNLLSQRLGGLLNRRIYHIPFSRDMPVNTNVVKQLESIYKECQKERGILIALPEQMLSFRLVGLDLVDSNLNLARELISLERWLQETCRDIIDESDEVLDPKFQLVYTVGNQQTLDGYSARWDVTQALLTVVGEKAEQLYKKDPTCLDIDQEGDRYPILHFLKADAVDTLITDLFQTISSGGLPGVPFNQWTPKVRKAALHFIRFVSTDDGDQTILREAFEEGVSLQKLLVLRGLLAHRVLRFVLAGKRWMVDYGLHPSRRLIAVPFRAKGVPSDNAEFGHPDVAVTLTCLSYYYEGLTQDQIRHCFSLLAKENDPSAEYQCWIVKCRHLPTGLHSLTGVNLEDIRTFNRHLYPSLRYQKPLIDFYLSRVVFPKEAKEFPRKLSTSAWDIPSQSDQRVTTGFSGTNDNRFLLPLSIPQRDLPHLLHTNAMVLGVLLRDENRQCILAQDSTGRQLRSDQLLDLVNSQDPPVKVIIDVGAQILEFSNHRVAKDWLFITPPADAEAAVFFNDDDEAMVIDREGHIDRLLASPFRQRMGACLVFLDQHHARGVDLKLPLTSRAAVTLGPRLTKDRLMQACNRMRELANGQSVTFFVPPEVSHDVRHLLQLKEDDPLNSTCIIRWALAQTCNNLNSLRPLWAYQGLQHHRRMRLWKPLVEEEGNAEEIVFQIQEPEAQTLLELYAPWEPPVSIDADEDIDRKDPCIQKLLEFRQACGAGDVGDSFLHEEQEREIAREVQQEQQVCRPPAVKPLPHQLHSDIRYFATHGVFPTGTSSSGFQSAFESLRRTSVGQYAFPSSLGPRLHVTEDFVRTVKRSKSDLDDEFLKPVAWILSSIHSTDLLILSQYEANELLPAVRVSQTTRLHVYAPRTTKAMRSFQHLDFLVTGAGGFDHQKLGETSRDVELFSGSLYFLCFSDYVHFRQFLGLVTDCPDEIQEGTMSNEGFVDEQSRQRLGWPVHSPFKTNPLPFLNAILNARGKGLGYLQTHVGTIVGTKLLTRDAFSVP